MRDGSNVLNESFINRAHGASISQVCDCCSNEKKESSPLGSEVVLVVQVHLYEVDYPATVGDQDREADVDEL